MAFRLSPVPFRLVLDILWLLRDLMRSDFSGTAGEITVLGAAVGDYTVSSQHMEVLTYYAAAAT